MCALWMDGMDGMDYYFQQQKNREKVERENRCVVAPFLYYYYSFA
jgi:hypothetical protein